MTQLRSILDDAEKEGLIPAEASTRLLPFLIERGVTVGAAVESQPVVEKADAWSDTETPRFVRGFHDVLITIGVIIVLFGLRGLAPIYVLLPVILILSEILVRRQRLALPAVALTIALVCWIAIVMAFAIPDSLKVWQEGTVAIQYAAVFPVLLGLYYLRYRVPLSLALCIMTALGLLLTVVFRLMQAASGDPEFPFNAPVLLSGIFVACALGLFLAALYFDLGDRLRKTTRSDIAFWLHLGAAPALLYSTISLFSFGSGWFDIAENVSIKTPVVVATVAILMLIGLVIDRRAFVTSGLLSLGLAIYGIFRQGNATIDTYLFTTLVVVGTIVLIIGTGWMPLRRLVLRVLPPAVSERLPPA